MRGNNRNASVPYFVSRYAGGIKNNMNYALNFVSSRDLYLRNPLRRDNEELEGYLNLDTTLAYRPTKEYSLTLKVQNVFDNEYYHPGGEQADSGPSVEGLRYQPVVLPGALLAHADAG